jgi:hypothetical protein
MAAFFRTRYAAAMNQPPSQPVRHQPSTGAHPPWAECDAFCIHSYSGAGGRPCGWRGKLANTRPSASIRAHHCPDCGRASVLPLASQSNQAGYAV